MCFWWLSTRKWFGLESGFNVGFGGFGFSVGFGGYRYGKGLDWSLGLLWGLVVLDLEWVLVVIDTKVLWVGVGDY